MDFVYFWQESSSDKNLKIQVVYLAYAFETEHAILVIIVRFTRCF